MKTALVIFKEENANFPTNKISTLTSMLVDSGFSVSNVEVLSLSDDLGFVKRLREFKDRVENLIIVNDDSLTFNLKEVIAEEFETSLIENENARKILDEMAKVNRITVSDEYASIPLGATLIPNNLGAYQGFMIEDNEFTLAVISGEDDQALCMCKDFILPYMETKYNVNVERVVLKLICSARKVVQVVDDAKQKFAQDFEALVTEKNRDVRLELILKGDTAKLKRDITRFFVEELKEDVYAEYDTTVAQRLFDIIKLKGLKLSTAESFTAGRLASSFIENSGASSYFHEGVVAYSNQSKIERLGVNLADLNREGAVSSVVAYQMALGLLKKGQCDVAISTTGIAGPKSDDTSKPVGLCFISIGLKNGIHTYKFNFNGSREEITETAVNVAQFLAIKILKRI